MEKKQSNGFDALDDIANQHSTRKQYSEAVTTLANIINNTFKTEQGAKALNVLTAKFYNQECFVGDKPDPFLAARRDGQRSVVMFIFEQIQGAKNGS